MGSMMRCWRGWRGRGNRRRRGGGGRGVVDTMMGFDLMGGGGEKREVVDELLGEVYLAF